MKLIRILERYLKQLMFNINRLYQQHHPTPPLRHQKKRNVIQFCTMILCKSLQQDVEDDSDENEDEVDRYINTKLPFSKDDTLLGWWDKHSLIFPQLSLLAKYLEDIHKCYP